MTAAPPASPPPDGSEEGQCSIWMSSRQRWTCRNHRKAIQPAPKQMMLSFPEINVVTCDLTDPNLRHGEEGCHGPAAAQRGAGGSANVQKALGTACGIRRLALTRAACCSLKGSW